MRNLVRYRRILLQKSAAKNAGLAVPDILLQPRHSRATSKRIQVCRLIAGPNHHVRHDRKRLRRNEVPLARHDHAQEWRECALTREPVSWRQPDTKLTARI